MQYYGLWFLPMLGNVHQHMQLFVLALCIVDYILRSLSAVGKTLIQHAWYTLFCQTTCKSLKKLKQTTGQRFQEISKLNCSCVGVW